jgi:hypothetical protein
MPSRGVPREVSDLRKNNDIDRQPGPNGATDAKGEFPGAANRINRLSARAVATLKCPLGVNKKRFADGRGLYLQVDRSGSRSWLFQFRWTGKGKNRHGDHRECAIGLGSTHNVTLAHARQLAAEMRAELAEARFHGRLDKIVARLRAAP